MLRSRCVHIFLSKLSVLSFVLFLCYVSWDVSRFPSEYFFFSERAAWGGALPDFVFLFSFPCSADHEQEWPPCNATYFFRVGGTNFIRRDSFVRTDQSQTSLAGKYCEIRPMKDDFCKDFIRTGRGDWRSWCISHSTMR